LPTVTIVIPAKNEGENLEDVISSLRHQTNLPEEIIVVDDSSTDNTVSKARALCVRVMPSEGKLQAGAMNTGARHAIGEIIVFLDGDMVASPKWLESIVKGIEHHGADICTGPVLPYYSTNIVSLAYHLPFALQLSKREDCTPTDFSPAANMGVRRDVFDRIGYFDENIWSQDAEFSFRARKSGLRLMWNREAAVRHKGYVSLREVMLICSYVIRYDWLGFRKNGREAANYLSLRSYLYFYSLSACAISTVLFACWNMYAVLLPVTMLALGLGVFYRRTLHLKMQRKLCLAVVYGVIATLWGHALLLSALRGTFAKLVGSTR